MRRCRIAVTCATSTGCRSSKRMTEPSVRDAISSRSPPQCRQVNTSIEKGTVPGPTTTAFRVRSAAGRMNRRGCPSWQRTPRSKQRAIRCARPVRVSFRPQPVSPARRCARRGAPSSRGAGDERRRTWCAGIARCRRRSCTTAGGIGARVGWSRCRVGISTCSSPETSASPREVSCLARYFAGMHRKGKMRCALHPRLQRARAARYAL